MQEVFSVILVNATGGGRVSIGRDSTSTITITGSDYPYRPFSFSPVFDPLTVCEDASVVTLERSKKKLVSLSLIHI